MEGMWCPLASNLEAVKGRPVPPCQSPCVSLCFCLSPAHPPPHSPSLFLFRISVSWDGLLTILTSLLHFTGCYRSFWTSLVSQTVKCLPTVGEIWVQSLYQEDLLEKEMAAHSSILAWKIPWTEKPEISGETGQPHTPSGCSQDWAGQLCPSKLTLEYSLPSVSLRRSFHDPGGYPNSRMRKFLIKNDKKKKKLVVPLYSQVFSGR